MTKNNQEQELSSLAEIMLRKELVRRILMPMMKK